VTTGPSAADRRIDPTGRASRHPSPRTYGVLAAAVAALGAVPLFTTNNYILHIGVQMFFWGYLGQAWNIMCGYTGQLSFGHAAFFGLGTYTSTLLLLKLGVSPWLGMFAGAGLAALLGVVIGAVSFKYGARGVFFAFITMAIGEIMKLLALYWDDLTNGAEGLLIPFAGQNLAMFSIAMENKYLFYYIILAMLVAVTYIAYRIKKARFGYYLLALRENEDAAEMIGVDVFRYKVAAVGVSAFLTAFGGTFYAHYYQHFEPEDIFGIVTSFTIIYPVIIGGGDYLLGPILGAVILTLFEEISRSVMPQTMHGFHRILYGVVIILVIVYLPNGLMELVTRTRTWWQRGAAVAARGKAAKWEY
jgi:branched-chain amino acid transport system permease protein